MVTVGFVAGCTRPTDTRIDASSPDAYQKSLQSIRAKLSPEEAAKLDAAVETLVLAGLQEQQGGLQKMLAASSDGQKIQIDPLAVVNGKTPAEVIALAEIKVRERMQTDLKSATSDIAELEIRKLAADKAAGVLAKIATADPSYSWAAGPSAQPVIEVKVTNNSGVALSHLYFHGVSLPPPGGKVPRVDEDFDYEVPGGLDDHATKRLRVEPDVLSAWGQGELKGQKDMPLSVTVVNAAGPDRVKVAAEFTKGDEERLSKLRSAKAEIEQRLAAK
jgi:hypothetical protein